MTGESNRRAAQMVLAEASVAEWRSWMQAVLTAADRAIETKAPVLAGIFMGCEVVVRPPGVPAEVPGMRMADTGAVAPQ